jgi:hypothetical protein
MEKRIQPLMVALATVGTVIFNYFAATGTLGGVATNVVSDRHPTVITPAGYAFAIWSLIYLGMIAFSIYQLLPSKFEFFAKIRRAYIVSCVLNCTWLYFWSQGEIALCSFILFLLMVTLAYINRKLATTATAGEYWLGKAPFGIYFGWVTAASLLNLMIALTANGLPMGYQEYLGAVFILLAGILAVAVRINITNYMFPLAIAWAVTAIAVKQSGKTLIVAVSAVAVIMSLIAAVSFVMSQAEAKKNLES